MLPGKSFPFGNKLSHIGEKHFTSTPLAVKPVKKPLIQIEDAGVSPLYFF